MSKELKDTQIYYGENVLMMRVDDCLIFGNKNALRSLAEKLTKLPSAEPEERTAKVQILPRRSETSMSWEGKCSNCGSYTIHEMNYCFECGAKLEWGNHE